MCITSAARSSYHLIECILHSDINPRLWDCNPIITVTIFSNAYRKTPMLWWSHSKQRDRLNHGQLYLTNLWQPFQLGLIFNQLHQQISSTLHSWLRLHPPGQAGWDSAQQSTKAMCCFKSRSASPPFNTSISNIRAKSPDSPGFRSSQGPRCENSLINSYEGGRNQRKHSGDVWLSSESAQSHLQEIIFNILIRI